MYIHIQIYKHVYAYIPNKDRDRHRENMCCLSVLGQIQISSTQYSVSLTHL